MRNLHEPTYSFVILTFILIIVHTLLAWFSVRVAPAGVNGLAWIFISVAFMLLFTLWFGAYGAIAAYVGTLVGAGFFASDRLFFASGSSDYLCNCRSHFCPDPPDSVPHLKS